MIDSVIRAPLLGAMLMALIASTLGALLFLRKSTLVGESLSHASYPGVALAILFAGNAPHEAAVLCIALLSSLCGYALFHFLQKKMRVKEDTALSFVLATFFGMGTLIASIVQRVSPKEFRQVQVFLYGQSATMSEGHVLFYALYAVGLIFFLLFCFRPLLLTSFDPLFAKTGKLYRKWIEGLFFAFVASSVVIAIRCVGVLMMASLFIAPPIAARQFTQKASAMLFLSALFGMCCGALGTLFSLSGLPTGPLITLIASFLAFFSLFFAPRRGLLIRYFRIAGHRLICREENAIKALWLQRECKIAPLTRFWLKRKGWIDSLGKLTKEGERKGAKIVRAHRLWEAYLVYSLGMGEDCVHHSAEEMEHFLTPELEEALSQLMGDPKQDPHAKPIPPREGLPA